MEERLQKYMARCGVDSRRKCEELIAGGLVEVNGRVVREPGVKIDPMRDRVKVDGKTLSAEKPAYYIHYKVKGVTTTVADDLGRRTVMDCLPRIKERVYPVGRLDRESEGLLVLTNDGALANYLTHPAFGVAKTYRVVAEGRVAEDTLRDLEAKGMRLGPVLVKPSKVELVRYDNDNTIVLISVAEGINREVRRIFAALGHEVKKLLRVQVGPLGLAGLKRGATRLLAPKELRLLRAGMEGMGEIEEKIGDLFPAGSAASRKPTGPRGRPRRSDTPRHGKPDPATNRQFTAKKKKVDSSGSGSTTKRDGSKPARTARRGEGRSAPLRAGKPAAGKQSHRETGRPSFERPDSGRTGKPAVGKQSYGEAGRSAVGKPGAGRTGKPAVGKREYRETGRPSFGKPGSGRIGKPVAAKQGFAKKERPVYTKFDAEKPGKPSPAGKDAARAKGAPARRPAKMARHPLSAPPPGGKAGKGAKRG